MYLTITPFFKTVEEGAQTSLYLACSEDVKNVSGKYFMDCKEWELQSYITDQKQHKTVWDESIKAVKLTEDDPKI